MYKSGGLAGLALFAASALGFGAGCAGLPDESDVREASLAVVSENGLSTNGLSTNGLSTNGLSTNGLSTNGLSTNGLSTNGLSTNGLSTNGLSTNGLSTNGLSTNGFSAWFDANPEEYSAAVMRYLVRCAVPEGESRTFESSDGVSYEWQGLLGLAPTWSAGAPIPVIEQQLVSACLAAHVNRFGLHVPISIRGRVADGQRMNVTPDEEAQFAVQEGCFFGNVFNGEGVRAAPMFAQWKDDGDEHSSPRACALRAPWDDGDCAPFLARLPGTCSDHCDGYSAETGTFASCSFGGVDYAPLSTSVRESEVYRCGDGVCQGTEVPYHVTTGLGCDDCGVVP